MTDILRNNWFVVLIAIIIIGFIGYFIYDTNKDNVSAKTTNNEQVVASINKDDITADDLYDEMLQRTACSVGHRFCGDFRSTGYLDAPQQHQTSAEWYRKTSDSAEKREQKQINALSPFACAKGDFAIRLY